MKSPLVALALLLVSAPLSGQAPGKWPPDSLSTCGSFRRARRSCRSWVMRTSPGSGRSLPVLPRRGGGQPLEQFDFASDQNAPGRRPADDAHGPGDQRSPRYAARRPTPCSRSPVRPVTAAPAAGSARRPDGRDVAGLRGRLAIATYRALRRRYYGRDAFDFGEPSLNIAAFRLGQAKRYDEASPCSDSMRSSFPPPRDVCLSREHQSDAGDTAAAEAAFREAIRRDSTT